DFPERGGTHLVNTTATTEIHTLSLHDALPIYVGSGVEDLIHAGAGGDGLLGVAHQKAQHADRLHQQEQIDAEGGHGAYAEQVSRSEEHTSELQSRENLVCRLLLEKKQNQIEDD